ncbi:restriction endonuclease subunit S [Bacteroides caecimuris]|uniref:restriction endonuclease subunit S n=1 Tax=Bacteroides caecimuris TaxID=1796613 RepID=UPI0025B10B84|nr:restriction endonuclease subunit S [Bacteroides caecimuris]
MADNNENKVLNVPPLRFPEFSGEWERKRFRDVCNITTGNKNTQDKSDDGIYPFYVRSQIVERINSWTFDGEAILTAGDGVGVGKVFHYSTGKIGVHQRVYILSDFKCDGKYLYSYFAGHFYNRVKRMSAKNSVDSVRMEMIADMPISLPSTEEQKKIGHLLALLDERIATQNKIIEDLKKLKSAIVEMLLCNRNSELLKLGDIGYFVRGLTYANEDVTENKAATAVIRANNLNYGNHVDKGEVVYVSRTPATSQILRKGDIVICMANGSSALVGKNSYYPFNDGQSTVGAFCGIYRTSHPLAKWLMQSRRYKRLVYQSLQGGNGAIANLNGDDILNMSFPVMEKEKSKSIIFILETIEKSLAVNKCLQRSYSTQKSHLLKQMFI